MGFQFPDAAMSGKPMKASYINDLRSKINVVRVEEGRTPINWGPDLKGGNDPDVIRDSHITDLRNAIRDLWLIKDLIDQASEFPGFANGNPASLTAFFASQTSDPRLWLNQAQNYPVRQGLNSLCHDPGSSGSHIGTAWVQDIYDLATSSSKRVMGVRCIVRKSGGEVVSDTDIARYADDFNLYRNSGGSRPTFTVYTVLNRETYAPSGQAAGSQNDPLITLGNPVVYNTNAYIESFASNIAVVVKKLYDQGNVRHFIIWNEPNDSSQTSKYMTAERFAALLRRTWMRCREQIGTAMDQGEAMIYWGGILLSGSKSSIGSSDFTYIRTVYQSVIDQKDIISENPSIDYHEDYGRTWPWHGINIHAHHERDVSFAEAVNGQLKSVFVDFTGDTNELLIGEWGIQLEGQDCTSWSSTPVSRINNTMSALTATCGTIDLGLLSWPRLPWRRPHDQH